MQDKLFTFSFAQANIRGAIVQTENSFTKLITQNGDQPAYPLFVKHLLGEMNALLLLMASNIKLDGKINLQIRGSGHLYSAFTEVELKQNAPLHVRGIARRESGSSPASLDLQDWVGKQRSLAITLLPQDGQPYQGIVPVDHQRIGLCLEDYYQRSEQLPTFFWSQINDHQCAALMLQQMPGDIKQPSIDMTIARALVNTIRPGEMLEVPAPELVRRLFHEFPVLQHDERAIEYRCSCSNKRMEAALLSLGKQELYELAQESPTIEMNCQFCGLTRSFKASLILEKCEEQS